jgi:hypothetical protein
MAGPNKPLPGYDKSMMQGPNQVINVALEPTSPKCGCVPGSCFCKPECDCMCCWGNGPGGKTTIVQYNEKGILEEGIHDIMSRTSQAELGSDHDSYAQGIYRHAPTPYGVDD